MRAAEEGSAAALVGRGMRAGLPVTAAVGAVAALYAVAVVVMYDPALSASMDEMMEAVPGLFAAFGMATKTATLLGFLVNYLYGFLLELLPFVLVVLVVSRLVARPAEDGSLAYVLAAPLERRTVAAVFAGVALTCGLLAVLVAAACELVCAELWFVGELDLAGFARVNAGVAALVVFYVGACLFGACAARVPGRGLGVVAGVVAAAYLASMAAGLGSDVEWLRYGSLFTLFDAFGLAAGEGSAAVGAWVLAGAGVGLGCAAVATFSHRDWCV